MKGVNDINDKKSLDQMAADQLLHICDETFPSLGDQMHLYCTFEHLKKFEKDDDFREVVNQRYGLKRWTYFDDEHM